MAEVTKKQLSRAIRKATKSTNEGDVIDYGQGDRYPVSWLTRVNRLQPLKSALDAQAHAIYGDGLADYESISQVMADPFSGADLAQTFAESAKLFPYFQQVILLVMRTGVNGEVCVRNLDATGFQRLKVDYTKNSEDQPYARYNPNARANFNQGVKDSGEYLYMKLFPGSVDKCKLHTAYVIHQWISTPGFYNYGVPSMHAGMSVFDTAINTARASKSYLERMVHIPASIHIPQDKANQKIPGFTSRDGSAVTMRELLMHHLQSRQLGAAGGADLRSGGYRNYLQGQWQSSGIAWGEDSDLSQAFEMLVVQDTTLADADGKKSIAPGVSVNVIDWYGPFNTLSESLERIKGVDLPRALGLHKILLAGFDGNTSGGAADTFSKRAALEAHFAKQMSAARAMLKRVYTMVFPQFDFELTGVTAEEIRANYAGYISMTQANNGGNGDTEQPD